MRLEWLEDILAVLDTGSFARAAEKRLVTQSAFTRRMRAIEDSIGAELFDRRKKPVELLPAVRAQQAEMRDLCGGLRKLRDSLRNSGDGSRRLISIACQHALATSISPGLLDTVAGVDSHAIRVRSGNRDECLTMLLSGEVDFALMYRLPNEPALLGHRAIQEISLGFDRLIPVAASHSEHYAERGEIPVVTYPDTVFLGQVVEREIYTRLAADITLVRMIETALTQAVLNYVINGIGIGWLPESMVQEQLANGSLVALCDKFPSQPLEPNLVRLSDTASSPLDEIWKRIAVRCQNQLN